MEDKHVCIPDFNMLFNLEVKGTPQESTRSKKHKTNTFMVLLSDSISDGLED